MLQMKMKYSNIKIVYVNGGFSEAKKYIDGVIYVTF